ncbi:MULTISPECIES: hypothetical protein [unclassified Haloferax]|jgi:hypothetical protein|uniref:hypothetical protein n=1 Tax=unclassified Haloferax TaxID=2625095 RepID=UPI000E2799FB|nr:MULTISPECIES: hypothetical protein [unclassified Haloferax]RDZ33783.1 hypothetical protein C5B88_18525 [Haloferax sp. Atlit-24N]RLM34305.1 hypothetical protein DVK03_17305 [Haloferax sp. Atlit-109R]RLM41124.1 hypothetical protein DVK04_17120 [Haloferax sp. Atlit-105R]
MPVRTLVDRLREPAYTESNRCLPCTAVNLVLLGLAVGPLWVLSPVAAVPVGVAGVTTIWLRGYLVPGTPALTRRYLPASVLAAFGTLSTPVSTAVPPDADPVEKLVGFGVLSADPGDDPALTPSFRAAWHEAAETLAGDPEALDRAAATVTAGDRPRITVAESDADGVVMRADGSWVGQWPSRTALVADLATERTLAGPAWDALGRAERVDLAARIRGLVEQCPTCRGPTRVSDETVESCCHTTAVIAVSCTDCGDRLAEFDPSPSPFAPGW